MDNVQRITTHHLLTPEKQVELELAAELEQADRSDAAVHEHHAKVFQQIEARKLARALQAQLVAAKEQQHLTYADLEQRTGIGRPTLNRLLTGQQDNPTLLTLVRVASALGQHLEIQLTQVGK